MDAGSLDLSPAASPSRDAALSRFRQPLGLAGNVLFVVALVFVLVAAALYAGLQLAGVHFYEVTSNSMAPTFSKGDVVGVTSLAAHDVKAGDVIVFRAPGRTDPLVHRVQRVQSNPDVHSILRDANGNEISDSWAYSPRTFFTKGDGNNVEDPTQATDQTLLGEQRFVVPWPFNLLVTRFDKQSLFLIGTAAVALFLILEGLDLGRAAWRRRHHRSVEPPPEATP